MSSALIPTPQARYGINFTTRAVVGKPPARPPSEPFVPSYLKKDNTMLATCYGGDKLFDDGELARLSVAAAFPIKRASELACHSGVFCRHPLPARRRRPADVRSGNDEVFRRRMEQVAEAASGDRGRLQPEGCCALMEGSRLRTHHLPCVAPRDPRPALLWHLLHARSTYAHMPPTCVCRRRASVLRCAHASRTRGCVVMASCRGGHQPAALSVGEAVDGVAPPSTRLVAPPSPIDS
jgi:hypothetical protein